MINGKGILDKSAVIHLIVAKYSTTSSWNWKSNCSTISLLRCYELYNAAFWNTGFWLVNHRTGVIAHNKTFYNQNQQFQVHLMIYLAKSHVSEIMLSAQTLITK